MTSLLWLSRDFRFDDNAALLAAASAGPVLPVFVIDQATRAQGSASRWRLGRALAAFDAEWRARTGEHITLLEGEAAELLPDLAARIGATTIHQNDWPTAAMQAAQAGLHRALGSGPTRLELHEGHLLIHPSRVRTGAGGTYRVYTPFARAVRVAGPDRPLAPPKTIQALPAAGALRAADLNRVSMVVASWLTKHLLTDWRLGLAHFEDSLTDWDPAANAMNWQWVAGCGPDASPFFRIFNPEKQAASFDPKARYRDHWLRGEGAAAYAATVPPSWGAAGAWQPGDTAALLDKGRKRALAELEGFNRED